ncbi:hypothetical protein [Calothrix rhizosoleniae]|uniref:hypothetical protein n=1 Tax=Calothrix rhizosoleniae TaxID=888997 RepID=UPI00190E8836|nr:hypothetical protein [Calothrix rhizosoleniae]
MHNHYFYRQIQLFLVTALVTLAGCNTPTTNNGDTSPTPTTTSTSSPTESPVSQAPSNVNVNPSQLISPQGIGKVRLGMTYGELKQSLGSKATFKVKSPFMVGSDAIAVNQSDKTLYHILYPTGTTFSNSSRITNVLTESPEYRTDKGVGAGTKIKDAEAAYGKATLSYNTATESREYVKFADYKQRYIYFRPLATTAQPFAGIYTSPPQELNKTNQFHEDAVIKSVQIICPPTACT